MLGHVGIANPEASIRVVVIDGEPWIIAHDVEKIVGGWYLAKVTRDPAAFLSGHCRPCDLDGSCQWLVSPDAIPTILSHYFSRKGLEALSEAMRAMFADAPKLKYAVADAIAFIQRKPASDLKVPIIAGLARTMGYQAMRDAEAPAREWAEGAPPKVWLTRAPMPLER